jgi:hypothetical protein
MKFGLVIFLLLTVCSAGFSQETGNFQSIGDEILSLISAGDTGGLEIFLDSLADAGEKTFAENFIIEQAKQSVLEGNLDLALALTEAVLLFNLDNTAAQNLYASIEQAKREKEELEEQERQAELERQQQEEELARIEEEKAAEEQKAAEEKEYEDAVSNVTLDNFSLAVNLSPVSFLLYGSGFADLLSGQTTLNSNYGLGVNGRITFTHPYVAFNLNFFCSVFFVPFVSEDLLTEGDFVLSVSSPLIGFPVYLRAGYYGYEFGGPEGQAVSSVLFQGISSPVLGAGIENLKLTGSLGFSFYADILTLFFTHDSVDFAVNLGTSFPVRIFRINDKMSFAVTPSASGTLLVSDGRIEWLSSISVSAGVVINE